MAQIKKDDSSYFQEFKRTIENGSPLEIKNAIKKANTLAENAAINMPSTQEAFKYADKHRQEVKSALANNRSSFNNNKELTSQQLEDQILNTVATSINSSSQENSKNREASYAYVHVNVAAISNAVAVTAAVAAAYVAAVAIAVIGNKSIEGSSMSDLQLEKMSKEIASTYN